MVYTLSEDYPTQIEITVKGACTPEGNKDEDIKAVGSK